MGPYRARAGMDGVIVMMISGNGFGYTGKPSRITMSEGCVLVTTSLLQLHIT